MAVAILFSAAFSNNARAGAFVDGDFVTYSQEAWGDTPAPGNAAQLLRDNYDAVYTPTLGVLQVGINGLSGFSIQLANVAQVANYLPTSGPAVPLDQDYVDPIATPSGVFGGVVTALKLNVDFSDAGVTAGTLGIPFGNLELYNFSALPALDGLTARQFLGEVNALLGGGASASGYNISQLVGITDSLNNSFEGGVVNSFAQEHLRVAGDSHSVPDSGSTMVLLGLGLVGLLSLHFRQGRNM